MNDEELICAQAAAIACIAAFTIIGGDEAQPAIKELREILNRIKS